MKLDQSMVGKKVKGVQWPKGEWFQIEWGRENLFAGFLHDGHQISYRSDEYCFEFVSETKLPSERIWEILRESFKKDEDGLSWSILKYLDEEAKKK